MPVGSHGTFLPPFFYTVHEGTIFHWGFKARVRFRVISYGWTLFNKLVAKSEIKLKKTNKLVASY